MRCPSSGSAAGGTAQLTFRVAGPHVDVTLNGEKLTVSDSGQVAMDLRPGEYEVVMLKNGKPVVRSGEVFISGQWKLVKDADADAIRVAGPLALPYGPGSRNPNVADTKAIQGRWTIISQIKDGEPFVEQQRGKWIEFDNDLMRSDVPETPRYQAFFAESRFTMNPAADPGQIDILAIGAKGIYRLEFDTLTLCIADAGHLRPTEFASRPGSSVTLTVFRRAKPPASGPIDLLALTAPDGQKDAGDGTWRKDQGKLICERGPRASQARIALASPPDEYDLEAVIERTEGDHALAFGMMAHGRLFHIGLDVVGSEGSGRWSGLGNVDGKDVPDADNPTRIPGPKLINGKKHILRCQIRSTGIAATLDDQPLFNYQGGYDRIYGSKRGAADAFFVYAYGETRYVVHRLSLSPYSPVVQHP